MKKSFVNFPRFGKPSDEDTNLPVSMVLLLREPRFITPVQLRLAAERAFGRSFAGTEKESRHVVMEATPSVTLMKAGPHLLSFLNNRKPYGDEEFPRKFAGSLPKSSQREAWATHTAWTAVDYMKGGADLELEYGVLAKLCAEMVDDNCAGLYVPREQSFIPNDGSLSEALQTIAGSRHLGV